MSLVLVEPSMSRRSNVTAVAARSARSAVAASSSASVVTTTSIVARLGAIIPAPFAKPPTVQEPSGALRPACLSTVSVVSTAVAARSPPRGRPRGPPAASSTPASSRSIGRRSPMSPVEQTATSIAPHPSTSADLLGGVVGVGEPVGPGAGVGAAGVEHDRAQRRARASTCWDHSTGAALTWLRVKTPAAVVRRPVVDDEREIGAVAVGAQPGADARGPEAGGGGDAHGREPRRRQAEGLVEPEGEVDRLEGAARGALGEVVDDRGGDEAAGVDGRPRPGPARCSRRRRSWSPAGRPRAAGARTAPRRRTWRRPRGPPPRRCRGRPAGALTTARMPRGIGARTGVNETVTGPAPSPERFWTISGVCRCAPPTP